VSAQTIAISGHYKAVTMKQQTVTTTATVITALASTDTVIKAENILVQALAANTVPIYIANSASVTAGTSGAIELVAGANINLPSNNVTWYVICASAAPKLQIVYMQGIS
jgi:hypothetical protein